MNCIEIYRKGVHRWLVFGNDPGKPGNVIDTNQVIVCNGNTAMMLDPGGIEIFPAMMSAVPQEVSVDHIHHVFLSHQDPDIGSSLALWRRVLPEDTRVYTSWLWTDFLAHIDSGAKMSPIPDQGMTVALGADVRLQFLPAHYMHSPGNFMVYDPAAKILFSSDIGAALLDSQPRRSMFVQDFAGHVKYMEGFHKRWLGSPKARDAWIDMVSRLAVDIMVPQHGLMFQGDDVQRFLDWLSGLEVGTGVAAIGLPK